MDFEQEFEEFLDHRVKIGRPQYDDSDPTKTRPVKTMQLVEADVPFGLQELSGDLRQMPGGKLEQATHDGFTGPGRDVRPDDVIQAISGPEAGKFFVVAAPPWKPLSSHLELRLEESADEKAWAADNPW